jgi:hypothetical protein
MVKAFEGIIKAIKTGLGIEGNKFDLSEIDFRKLENFQSSRLPESDQSREFVEEYNRILNLLISNRTSGFSKLEFERGNSVDDKILALANSARRALKKNLYWVGVNETTSTNQQLKYEGEIPDFSKYVKNGVELVLGIGNIKITSRE